MTLVLAIRDALFVVMLLLGFVFVGASERGSGHVKTTVAKTLSNTHNLRTDYQQMTTETENEKTKKLLEFENINKI